MDVNFGAVETQTTNRVYLNLRTGKLSETSKEAKPGFKPFTTENASGTKYHFFAKTFDYLICFIKDVKWHEFEYEGKKIVGWNVVLDTGEKDFVLQINSSDRPYQTLMSVLPNVDFSLPVRVVAFMGKSMKGKPQKVLLFSNNVDRTAKDWVQSKYYAKWMSKLLSAKLKDILSLKDEKQIKDALDQLTIDETKNIAFDEYGMPDRNYPYVRELSDGTWSHTEWTEFLKDAFESETIPRIQAAANIRGVWWQGSADEQEFSGGATAFDDDFEAESGEELADSEIPF